MFFKRRAVQTYRPPQELALARISRKELDDNHSFTERMKLNPYRGPIRSAIWFLPWFDHVLKGGLRTAFMIADNLSREWQVENIFVIDNFYGRDIREDLEEELHSHFPELRFRLIVMAPDATTSQLPDADIGICTLWVTAYTLARYNRCKSKFYLMQDYEPEFYSAGAVSASIEYTYRLGFFFIANSPGVASKFLNYSNWGMAFKPGVDHAIFRKRDTPPRTTPPYTVVFYGRPTNARNCFPLAIEALKLLKRSMGDAVRIVSVGAEYDEAYYELEGAIENLGLLPSMEAVAELYREADLGLCLMATAHPSYQPLEYMASGCPCVTNINESNRWLYEDGSNIILAEPLPSLLAERMIETLNSPELRSRIIEGGLETVNPLTWDSALAQIREYISAPGPYTDQAQSFSLTSPSTS